MSPVIIVVLALFVTVTVVSAVRIMRLALSFPTRYLLLALRISLVALLAVAFIEPSFVFERLPSPLRPVPVLVDVSKSMRLFSRDDVIFKTLSSLEQWNSGHADEKQRFVFYCFGDSLRPLREKTPPSWLDRRSYLPVSMNDRILQQATAMVLISDGNWSNTTLQAESFSDKNVYYLPLYSVQRCKYLQMGLYNVPESHPAESPLVATVSIEGVSEQRDTVAVRVMEKNRTIAQQAVPVDPGFFRHDLSFRLRNLAAGRHLLRCCARSFRDTMVVSRYAITTVLPERFGYALYNARPVLDRRFMQLALKRHTDFIESPAGKEHDIDLLILFDWDDEAKKELGRLKSRGVFLFVGTLPCLCSLTTVQAAMPNALVRPLSDASTGPFDGFDFTKLPPASSYVSCKEMPFRVHDNIITAVLPRIKTPGFDTLRVLFTGRYDNRNFIACAASDLWRWDFLPLAVEPSEERVFSFSEGLLALTKEVLMNGLSDELLLYPAAPLSESDSLRFTVLFPADLPVPADMRFNCRISDNVRAFDTAFILTDVGSTHQVVRFKPLSTGNYTLEAKGSYGNRRYAFSDSITVDQDLSEYALTGQNISLLQEIAQPLSNFSAASLRSVFFTHGAETAQPVKETVRFNRNWPLLILIFLFFAAEWVVRRKIRLD